MSVMSAPARVAADITNAVKGLVRRGTVSSATHLYDATVDVGDLSFPVATAVVPFAIGEVPTVDDEVVMLQVEGQPVLFGKLVRSGVTPTYSPIPVVSSLPTASATYRGVALRLAGAAGSADATYTCLKDAADAYSWVVDTTPATLALPKVAALPTASATYRGMMLRTEGGSGVADVVSVCLKASGGTYSWKAVATG